MDEVRDKITAAVPRLHIEFVQILSDVINDLAGAARPVEIKVFGESLDTLEAYGRRLAPELSRIAGLQDLYNGVSEPSAELLMRLNQAEADRLGMTPSDVGNAVSAALLGVQAGEVRLGDRPIGVRVRAPDSVRFDALRLRALPLMNAGARRPRPLAERRHGGRAASARGPSPPRRGARRARRSVREPAGVL
jgi:HAE1 family hydrophobic/amphiphilic exporter-1